MPDQLPPLMLLAGVTSLLRETLERDELARFNSPELLIELERLADRLDAELETIPRPRGLHLAEPPDDSDVGEDRPGDA
jgi:hypothetical protein